MCPATQQMVVTQEDQAAFHWMTPTFLLNLIPLTMQSIPTWQNAAVYYPRARTHFVAAQPINAWSSLTVTSLSAMWVYCICLLSFSWFSIHSFLLLLIIISNDDLPSRLPQVKSSTEAQEQDQDTTRFGFSDNSFGFINNATYYAADGTFVDFKDGYYSSTDGSTGTFAPATAAATAAASSSDVGAAATSTMAAGALAHQSPTTSSSSVASTRQSSVTAPTNSPSRSSGGSSGCVIVMPSREIGLLGLGVVFFGVLLAWWNVCLYLL